MMQSRSIAGFPAVPTIGPRLVFVALLFNMLLCLITTRAGVHMSNAVVIVVELSILSVGLFVIRHRISAQAAQVIGVMSVFLIGMKLINPGLDLKIVHDIGIMYIFYELGMMSSLRDSFTQTSCYRHSRAGLQVVPSLRDSRGHSSPLPAKEEH